MKTMFQSLFYAFLFAKFAIAHMEVIKPYPIRSPVDPDVQNKDYDYKVPLAGDGSNYPCKLYHNDSPQVSKATYTAGQSYQMTVAGAMELSGGDEDAVHGGGSCQLSLSYDNAQTFHVIKSIIGGCPIQKTYTFTIPSFAPSSNSALFAWTWFNKMGNREMYMNCARVTIQGSISAKRGRYERKRQNTLDSLPDIYKCNIGAKGNGCVTKEGEDVQFPNPGPDIERGQDIGGNQIAGSSGSSMNGPDTSGNSGAVAADGLSGTSGASSNGIASATPASNSIAAPLPESITSSVSETGMFPPKGTPQTTSTTIHPSNAPSVSPPYPMSNSTSYSSGCKPKTTSPQANIPPPTPTFSATFHTSSLELNPVTASSQPAPSMSPGVFAPNALSNDPAAPSNSSIPPMPATDTSSSASCSPGFMRCDSSTTFSQCAASGSYISMGAVPAGMQCVNGSIIRQNKGACQTEGAILCENNGKTFMRCVDGGLMDMGSVRQVHSALMEVLKLLEADEK